MPHHGTGTRVTACESGVTVTKCVTVRPPCQIEFGDLGIWGSRARLQRWILERGRSQKGSRSRETSRDKSDDERRLHKSTRLGIERDTNT